MDPAARATNRLHQLVFNVSKGRVGRRMMHVEIVMLTTTGRRSGKSRRSMVGAPIIDDERIVVCASYGGAPNDPQWVLNLRSNPTVELTHRGRTRSMQAREAEGDERDALWARVVIAYRGYETYQAKAQRQIPVIILEPIR
jgi:deazaflavin-dependent oxidoreductase (nitroreductase family)